jgi:hypothetical protein
VEGLSRILGCGVDSVPFTYLGLPLGAHYKDPTIWNNVIEKMETKLARWKQMYLSKGGRQTMIKSTLNILTYYLSVSAPNESDEAYRKNTKRLLVGRCRR